MPRNGPLKANLSAPSLPSRPRIGLVLGAGGVRGCAHPGALKVLDEADIPIDVVVGASIGAILGLAMAAGLPAEQISRSTCAIGSMDLFRFYASRLRTSASNPISRMLYEAGEGRTFEDLEKTFGVVATNLETGQPELISSGPVLPAVEASIALPVVAKAVALNGRFYLDGGICDTLPAWAARQLGAEKTIGVRLGYNYGTPQFLRGPLMQGLFRRFAGQTALVRGSLADQFKFACRQMIMTVNGLPSRAGADVTIEPDFENLNPNSMFGARFSYWKGVEATRAVLPEIERLVMAPAATTATRVGSGDPELGSDQVIRMGDFNPSALERVSGVGIDNEG